MEKKYLFLIIVLFLALTGYYFLNPEKEQPAQESNESVTQLEEVKEVPLTEAKNRITKKPFGIYVTPESSPVEPEKFTGFHSGADFEIKTGEENKEVPVKAICDGEIINSQMVSGYGGVLLQNCNFGTQKAIVLYGHVDLTRITKTKSLKKSDFLTIMAPGFSQMSGGERKHLHLGIIKGEQADYRGYVQSQNELSKWLDPENYI